MVGWLIARAFTFQYTWHCLNVAHLLDGLMQIPTDGRRQYSVIDSIWTS